jgi:RNA polymerase sigma-70 factor (ECF subfamily)
MDLIRRSQAGDERAFAELFHQYKNLVYKTAILMLDEAEEADDALQEVFLQVHKSLGSYQPSKGAFTTWLHRVTVNHCLNRMRRRRWKFLSLTGIRPDQAPRQPSPEDRLRQEDTVSRAIQSLSGKLRAVVVLRYYWDMSYAEIANTLAIPLGTVKSRLNTALRSMRGEIQPSAAELFPDEEVVK